MMSHDPTVLVIDSRQDARETLTAFLRVHGRRALEAKSAADARKMLNETRIDIVVMDVALPGEDGLAFCRYLSVRTKIPVIIISERGDDMDRIIGLGVGADDYLSKPVSLREVLARIEAVLRRAYAPPPSIDPNGCQMLRFDRWTLIPDTRELLDENGDALPLGGREFLLLTALVRRPGTPLTRAQLLELETGRGSGATERSVDTAVSRLRMKIERNPYSPQLIRTVFGVGYRFDGVVEKFVGSMPGRVAAKVEL